MVKYVNALVVGVLFFVGILFEGYAIDNVKNDKGIYYDNVKYSENVKLNDVNGLNIDYNAELLAPGDFYELTFDVVNDSLYDVSFADITINDDDDYIDFDLTYSDGNSIKLGDVLKKGEKKQLKYKVLYKNLVLEDYEFDTNFMLNFEQV